MLNTIRALIAANGRLPVPVDTLTEEHDLYTAGLTSYAAVELMLALEHVFRVQFPDAMLNRRSFASIGAIAGCIKDIRRPARDLQPLAA